MEDEKEFQVSGTTKNCFWYIVKADCLSKAIEKAKERWDNGEPPEQSQFMDIASSEEVEWSAEKN